MRIFFYHLFFLPFLLLACKHKAQEVIPQADISEYMPLKIGNYWVYQEYHTDNNNNQIFNNAIDSIYISKDTLINNQKFYKMERKSFLEDYFFPLFISDSSSYILSYSGAVILCPDTNMVFQNEGSMYTYLSKTCHKDSLVITPLDSFKNTITFKTYLRGKNGFPSGNHYWIYAKQVGIIQREIFYASSPIRPAGIKLIRYHLE